METGCAIGGTTSRRQYAGGRRRGLSRQSDVQLAPCAWRLSKQSGAVRGCRNGGELALEFIARGTGSARRSIGAGAARSGARVLSGSTRENAARAVIDYSRTNSDCFLAHRSANRKPRGWCSFRPGISPSAAARSQPEAAILDARVVSVWDSTFQAKLLSATCLKPISVSIESAISSSRKRSKSHRPVATICPRRARDCRRRAPTLRANMPAAARGRDCRRPPRYSRSGDPSRANSLCRICRMRRQPCSRQGWQSLSRWLRAAARGAPWRCRSA